MENARKRFYNAGFIVFVIAIASFILWLLSTVKVIITLLIASVFLAYILLPMVRFFENPIIFKLPEKFTLLKKEIPLFRDSKKLTIRKKGFSRIVSVIAVYLVLALIIGILTSFVVPNLITEFNNFISNFPTLKIKMQERIDQWNLWLQPKLPDNYKDIIPRTVSKYSGEFEKYIYMGAQYTFLIAHKILSTALAVFIIPIFTFYILMDTESFKKAFTLCIPRRHREQVLTIAGKIDQMLGRYIRGQIVVSCFIAVAITIALLFLGIDYAFLIGLLSGLVNFIPYLGVVISLIPAMILALISKGLLWALLVFVVLQLIQQLEGQIISPAVMGEAVGLPPLIIILALIIGGQTMGLVGMLIAIPLVATIKVIFGHFIEEDSETPDKKASDGPVEDRPDAVSGDLEHISDSPDGADVVGV